LAFILTGFGNGLQDAAWNAFLGNMQNANEVLGFLHGAYGLGATLSPLIATTMVTKGGLGWFYAYYFMIGAVVLSLFLSTAVFWSANGQAFRDECPRTTEKEGGRTKEVLSSRVTWICAMFLFVYVGVEVALGGWVVRAIFISGYLILCSVNFC
jgi:fucose permease